MADPVWAMANLLFDCLQAQFNTPIDGLPTPGNFCLRAGEEISEDIDPIVGTDLCCEGFGWVRIGDTFPSSNFPEPDSVIKPGACLPVGWAQQLEIGLLGCYIPGTTPHMVDCAVHTDAAVADAARLEVIKKAICCWDAALKKDPRTRNKVYQVVGIGVQGPRGNCISRVGQILVSVGKCC